jgi:hypothetical protein
MKLKTRWLVTVGLTTLVLVAASSLSRASQQIWKPEVAHAARVTASLLKSHSIRPIFLHRGSPSASRSIAPLPLPLRHTELASYTLNQPFSSDRSRPLEHDRKPQNNQHGKVSKRKANISSWESERSEFQNWLGSVKGTAK